MALLTSGRQVQGLMERTVLMLEYANE